jgi:hypothetical protein
MINSRGPTTGTAHPAGDSAAPTLDQVSGNIICPCGSVPRCRWWDDPPCESNHTRSTPGNAERDKTVREALGTS